MTPPETVPDKAPRTLEVEVAGAVAVLRLADPARRNALTEPLVGEIVAAVDRLAADPAVRALVVTGAPPAFCAGADLSDLGLDREGREAGLRGIYAGFAAIADCALPTVAAVNGAAVGAGMNLALACDLRLAGASARFQTRFLELGLHPGGGHTWMLARAVGPQAAAAALLFNETLDAPEALRIGLVHRVVPDDALLDAAVTLAGRAAAGPREVALRVKESLRRQWELDSRAAAMEAELEPQLWSMDQPEFARRLAGMRQRISSRDRDA